MGKQSKASGDSTTSAKAVVKKLDYKVIDVNYNVIKKSGYILDGIITKRVLINENDSNNIYDKNNGSADDVCDKNEIKSENISTDVEGLSSKLITVFNDITSTTTISNTTMEPMIVASSSMLSSVINDIDSSIPTTISPTTRIKVPTQKRLSSSLSLMPIIIFCHGTLSDARHNFTDELTTKLALELGLISYRFNFRLDQSKYEPNHRYRYSGYIDDIEDLKDVIVSLKNDGYLPWCLFGHSRGANDVLLYSSRYCCNSSSTINNLMNSNIKSANDSNGDISSSSSISSYDYLLDENKIVIIVAAPRYDMKKMSSTIFSIEQLDEINFNGHCEWNTARGVLKVTKEDIKITNEDMNMYDVINNISLNIPILLLHGTEDELIPVNDAKLYKENRDSIDLVIIENARHAFRGKKQNKVLLTTIKDWVQKQYSALFP
jgi:pimeloyl-ACP methyl ester carboxylesterase